MALLRIIGASIALGYLSQRFSPYPIGTILSTLLFFLISCIFYAAWNIVVYPRFFSPLRHLPFPTGDFFSGQTREIMRDPSGLPMRRWTENIPNDGLIRYSLWFRERLLLTTPKTLGEVLVNKNYEFVKVWLINTINDKVFRTLDISCSCVQAVRLLTTNSQGSSDMDSAGYWALGFYWQKATSINCNVKSSCQRFHSAISKTCTQSSGANLVKW